ncbi:MAG TPA: hypothetical protein VFB14_16820 [Bryobacteraceae bacterium]|jgi:hypothetical protein|nr:hypothetical protein [Bryobacteraceae bacterium]
MLRASLYIAAILLVSCGGNKTEQTQSSSLSPNAVNYAPRIGVAVNTGQRTCVAIHNTTLTPDSSITIVMPAIPQSFTQAQITGRSPDPCPVTKELDTTVSNYEVRITQGTLPKLIPAIAVVGSPASFSMDNNMVKADLEQNGKAAMFRACSGSDGIHLTVWPGTPLSGAPVWRGFYYEPSNPGVGPACTAAEMAGPASP